MKLARALCGVLAVVVCAWFVLGIRQAHDLTAASNIAGANGALSPQDAAHGRALLATAADFNPDVQVDITRSQLAIRQHNYPQAIAYARTATRREPRNVATWLALAVAGFDSGKAIPAAVGKLSQLDPQLAHPAPHG